MGGVVEGLVGFKPTAVFDVSQTEGEPLPDLDTAAMGDGEDLVDALLEAAGHLDLEVKVVAPEEWPHGEAKGACQQCSPMSIQPLVEVKDRPNDADLPKTLIHEYAHARLHFDIDDDTERSKREAEAVAYIVGRYFGLDTSNSAYYLVAWEGDESEAIQDRLERISRTAKEFIRLIGWGV